jgi:hypothetical protein
MLAHFIKERVSSDDNYDSKKISAVTKLVESVKSVGRDKETNDPIRKKGESTQKQ